MSGRLLGAVVAAAVAVAVPARAQPVTVNGTVVDDDGAPVAGAIVTSGDREVTTDARGRFTIVARGDVTVVADGFLPSSTPARARLRIELVPSEAELIELVDDAPEETTPTAYVLTADEIRTTPGAMNDALRAVTILPAAARIPFSFGGLVLRGMSPRDTSVFVDGVEIPIAFHFGGISSVFPSSLLEDLRVVPSGFDVSIGRTQGGAIELFSRRPRRDRLRVAGEVSLLHAAASAEGPLWGGGGFLLGVRRSYVDTLLRPFLDRNDPTPSYLDAQARAVWGSAASGETTAYVLGSLDRIANSEDAATPNDPFADGYFAANLGFVRVGAQHKRWWGKTTVQAAPFVGTNLLSMHARDYGGDATLDETRIHRRWYQFGGRGEWQRDDAGGFVRAGVDVAGGYLGRVSGDAVADDLDVDELGLPRNTVLWTDAAVWIEARRHWWGDRLSLRPGVRVDRFGLGNETTVDPRLNGHLGLTDATILRASIGRFHQPPSPAHFDEFLDNLQAKSSYVDQATLALEWKASADLGATAVGFWHDGRRTLVDAVLADDGVPELQSLVFRELLEEQLGFYGNQANGGRQRSYGVELSVRYLGDRFRMMANYAWSRSLRTYLLPDRRWQPYGLDQPLRFNLVAATTARRWNVGLRVTAVSGNPTRLYPAGTPIDGHDRDQAPLMRLPMFWQVDLRIDRAWPKSYGTLSLFFDILNVTNHRNVEMRENVPDDFLDPMTPPRWSYQDTRGLPIIPTVGLELVPR
ncbi:MAG TPA: TonB-dependent receptor [Kofleriaceae bacterium]|jgi:hypothetical protein|nr:TonB-dependent receptor [Kofleriaceae bacterium]